MTVATFSDANPNATVNDFTAMITWGDGSTSAGSVVATGNGFAVTGTHTYADEDSYLASVAITDKGGSTANASTTVTVNDAALTAAAGAPLTGTEGAALTGVTVATFSDANPNATVNDFTAMITWGDGSTSAGTVVATGNGFAVTGTHTYADEGSYLASVAITDKGGSTANASTTVTVNDAALTAAAAAPLTGTEGAALTGVTVATFSDANPNATVNDFTAMITWGDGSTSAGTVVATSNGFAVTGTHTYADEDSYLASVAITDKGGSTANASTTVTVNDAALTAAAAAPLTGTEGTALTGVTVATFSDANPNATVNDFTAMITWGDGSTSAGTVVATGNGFAVTGTHTYADEDSYLASVAITDEGGSTASASTAVTVNDAALTAAVAAPLTGTEGAVLTGVTVATFSDANPNATVNDFTAMITWGDGGTSAGTVVASGNGFAVTGTHAYAEEGSYLASVAITDDGSSTANASTAVTVNAVSSLSVSISGIVREGSVLTATPTIGDSDDTGATVSYEWQSSTDGSSCSDISGATGSTYTVAETDEHDFIRVHASFTDDTSQLVSADSAATATRVVDNSSLSVSISGTVREGSVLTATPTIGDSDDTGATVSYQWQNLHRRLDLERHLRCHRLDLHRSGYDENKFVLRARLLYRRHQPTHQREQRSVPRPGWSTIRACRSRSAGRCREGCGAHGSADDRRPRRHRRHRLVPVAELHRRLDLERHLRCHRLDLRP